MTDGLNRINVNNLPCLFEGLAAQNTCSRNDEVIMQHALSKKNIECNRTPTPEIYD